jgi:hypothetical protein
MSPKSAKGDGSSAPNECPNCGATVEAASHCRNCGFAFPPPVMHSRKGTGCLGGIVFGVGMLLLLAGAAFLVLWGIVGTCAAFATGPSATPKGLPREAIVLMVGGAVIVLAAIAIWIVGAIGKRK